MTQPGLGLDLSTKRTRKRKLLDELRRVVPWSRLIALIEPHYPRGKTGRPPFPIATMLQIHFMQQWFGLSDPALEEALYDVPLYREFAGLDEGMTRLPDESTILRFRHLLETHGLAAQMLTLVNEILSEKGLMLKVGSAVDATLISAPTSTKNGSGTRDPEMHQTKKGNQWYFGMKAHVGVDAESGLVHTVIGTAASVHDINAAEALLHDQEMDVYADAGYQGIEKRCQVSAVRWHVAMRPGRRRQLDLTDRLDAIFDQIERLKAGIRAKVEHPFRVLKQQFGYTKSRYRGLMKNTAQITTLFALGNLWMARKALWNP
ncbi:IS5 family transposase [Paraburkholderia atlantica]|uniref:IS5 family transposase n=4 Tax=Paraburkholderia TaxID=1822464 RepID=A0A7W8LE60_9BURK|nr:MULTISPECIES: IS5 family transposase [Paraburkholderia]MBB5405321.1 IS5 family transposase [Paraburkholderia youngii]MBB5429546.1 IS5 family transposase [Paraburkholderia atlantica]NUY35935.1 IS5 family transposase [Paraburkholderia atlantica]